MLTICLEYRADRQTIYVSYPTPPDDREYFLDTEEDVEEHGQALRAFWRERCAGQRVHWVLNFDNFSVSPQAATPERILQGMRTFLEAFTLSVIRYGGGILPRSQARWMDKELGGPLYLCNTEDEAEEALRRLRGPEFSAPVGASRGATLNC